MADGQALDGEMIDKPIREGFKKKKYDKLGLLAEAWGGEGSSWGWRAQPVICFSLYWCNII